MRYGIELHARGRQIVECEAFDKSKDGTRPTQTVAMSGYVSHRDHASVVIIVPTSNNPVHRFSLFDTGGGFGYEGSPSAFRGWRVKLSQLKLDTVPEP